MDVKKSVGSQVGGTARASGSQGSLQVQIQGLRSFGVSISREGREKSGDIWAKFFADTPPPVSIWKHYIHKNILGDIKVLGSLRCFYVTPLRVKRQETAHQGGHAYLLCFLTDGVGDYIELSNSHCILEGFLCNERLQGPLQ